MRWKRVGGGVAAIFGVVVTFAVIAVFVLTNTDWGRAQVRVRALGALQGVVHGRVSIGALSGNLLRGIVVDSVSITDSTGAPFVFAERARVGYALRSLLSRRIDLSDVQLVGARVVLDRPARGLWNYDRIFPRDTTASTGAPGFGSWIMLRDVSLIRSDLLVRIADDTSQRITHFEKLNGHMPLVRIADVQMPNRRVEVDSLRSIATIAGIAEPIDVRQVRGVFELDADSVWFSDIAAALPASQLVLRGRYTFENDNMLLNATGAPAALADFRFLMPELPDRGQATLDAMVLWEGAVQKYAAHSLDLVSDSTRVRGRVALTRQIRGTTPADVDIEVDSASLDFDAFSTMLIEQLVPSIHAPVQGSLNGHVVLSGAPTALTVDGDVRFTDRAGRQSHLLADGIVGTQSGALVARGLRVDVRPLHASLVRAVAPALPIDGVFNGRAVLDGRSNGRLVARAIQLEHRDAGAVSRVNGTVAVTFGRDRLASLDVDVNANPLALATVGKFAPAAELRGTLTGPVRAQGPLSALAVNASMRTNDGGQISARGTLDVASTELGYALDVETVLFNAQELSAKAPRTALSAAVQTRARGTDPATVRGTFSAHLLASRLDTVEVDSLTVRARAGNGVLSLDSLSLFGPSTLIAARGDLGLIGTTNGNIDWSVRVDSLAALERYLPKADTGAVPARPLRTAERRAQLQRDSAQDARVLAVARAAGEAAPASPVRGDSATGRPRDSLAGSLVASGKLFGNINDLSANGHAELRNVIAQGQAVSRFNATFDAAHLPFDSLTLRLKGSADSARVGGFALDSVSLSVDHRRPGGSAEIAVYQNTSRDYTARADYALFADRQELRVRDLKLRFDSTFWTTAHPGGIRWGQPGVFIDSLDLRSGVNGRVFADGRIPSEGAVDLAVIVNNFELGDLLGLAQSDLAGRGKLSLRANMVGTARDPRGDATIALTQAQYQGAAAPNVTAEAKYANQRLDASMALRDTADTLRAPKRAFVTAIGSIPLNLALSGVTESRLPDGPLTGSIKADSLPLELMSRLVDVLANMKGHASGAITLGGTARAPTLDGGMQVRDGAARLTPLGIDLTRVYADVRLRKDTILVDSLVGWSGGRLDLRGGIGIKTISAPAFDLRFAADRARVLDNDQGRVRADARITATGPFDNVVVSGSARIRDGVLYIPRPDDREVISAGDPAVFAVVDTTDVRTKELVPAQSPLLANLRMDLGLSVDRDTWVRSPEANIEIFSDGELRVLIDRRRQALALDGIVNTDRGEYEFLGKRFQVKRGAVQFIGTQEINPLLQITGEYSVQQPTRPSLAVRILIGGTLNSPRLTLESDAQPPISQSDLLSYLAFGSEAGSLLQFGGSSLSGGSATGGLVGTSAALATRQLTGIALGVAVNELEGQAARSLGADVFTITPANLPPELASGNFGALTTFLKGTQFSFGKYLSTRTFLGLQLQATTTPGFRVQHQLSRTPGFSLDLTFQPRFFLPEPSLSEQQITKANALGLFLSRRWRF